MLGVRTYSQPYIDQCRSKVDSDITSYRNLLAAARNQSASDKALLDSAIEAFEGTFFNNMVLVLDECFVHRLRTIEGKDGNPLNEVRVMCDSMLNHKGVMSADKTIKLDPSKTVLKYRIGDQIRLNEADFLLIFQAFFADIKSKYL